MLKLSRESFNWPVKFNWPIDGQKRECRFTGRFKRIPIGEYNEVREAVRIAVEKNKDALAIIQGLNKSVLIGTDGLEVESTSGEKMTQDELLEFVINDANISPQIFAAYRDALDGGLRAKN